MSRRDMIETLDVCLRRIAAGSTIDAAVADFPDQAAELRELLEIALATQPSGRPARVPASAQVNSRKRLLAKAEQLKSRPRLFNIWSGLRFFRDHVGSAAFVAGMVALLFVALGSVNALPGDGLYPVKLAAEKASISLAASDATRLEREAGFDTLRAEEVARMIQQQRSGPVAFGGFLTRAEIQGWQAAGIPLKFSPAQEPQATGLEGVFVEIKGELGSEGVVSVKTMEPLLSSLNGVIEKVDAGSLTVSGKTVQVRSITKLEGAPRVGSQVAVQAARLSGDNGLLAISIAVNEKATSSPTIAPTLTAQPTATTTASPTPTASPTMRIVTPQPTPQPPTSGDDSEDHKTSEPKDGGDDGGHDDNHEPQKTEEVKHDNSLGPMPGSDG